MGYGEQDIPSTSTILRTRTHMTYLNQPFDREPPGTGPSATYLKHNHSRTGMVLTAGILILFCIVLVTGASAAETKTAYMGDMVTLSGSSPGSDIVYLFMTGPNLPSNGVALNNINRRTDMGGFSTADVDPDGHWVYKWYTNQLGGKLDTGTYTIWVTDRPVDRSHLSGSDYRSIPVTLQQPGVAAGSSSMTGLSTATGVLLVTTVPEGAFLFLDGENRGVTPVTIPDLPVGSHILALSSPGYQNLTTHAVVLEGAITAVNITLSSANGSIYANTTPAGAEISIDGNPAGVSPLLVADLVPGNHTLEARKAGYNTTREEVRVIGGHMMVAQLSLGKETPSPNASPPATRAAGIMPVSLVLTMIAYMVLARRPR
jgi:hypothetical protein